MRTWTESDLDSLKKQGDPEADRIVKKLFAPDVGPGHVMRALVENEVPHRDARYNPLREYLDRAPKKPPWFDHALAAQGQQVFVQWGPQILTTLLCASLPQGYMARHAAQVLHLTGRMVSDTKRRIVETAQLVVDAMTPGGLDINARGYTDVRRVRLMHAAIRHFVQQHPIEQRCGDADDLGLWWCPKWGKPLSQEQLLGTLLTFTGVVFEALPKTGVHLSDEQMDAYMHAWNYVGYLLGIRPDLLPIERGEMQALGDLLKQRNWEPSAAGREVAGALVEFAEDMVPVKALRGLPVSAIRYMSGDHVADTLGLEHSDWTHFVMGPARNLIGGLSLEEPHSVVLRFITERMADWMIDSFMSHNRGGTRPQFRLPRRLRKPAHRSPTDRQRRAETTSLPIAGPIRPRDVDQIADISDPVLRNLWITYAYHDFAVRLSRFISPGMTWCAFAVWASNTVGSLIRMEELPGIVRERLKNSSDHRDALKAADAHVRRHLELGRMVFDTSTVEAAIADIVGDVGASLAEGNTIVFVELAPIFARMLELYENRKTVSTTWPRRLVEAFAPKHAARLVPAFENYRKAITQPKRDTAQFVFAANVEAVAHEQERLQPAIARALNAPISDILGGHLKDAVDRHRGPGADDIARAFAGLRLPIASRAAGLAASVFDDRRMAVVKRALRPVVRAIEKEWCEAATELLMQLRVVDEHLRLAEDVPALNGELFPSSLSKLSHRDVLELASKWDRTHSSGKGSGAENWTELGDRMNYIYTLFRSRQENRQLLTAPFGKEQLESMRAGEVPATVQEPAKTVTAVAPRRITFPRDHANHPESPQEWWYFVGHLTSPIGEFGCQAVFMRLSFHEHHVAIPLHRTDFALTDLDQDRFLYHVNWHLPTGDVSDATLDVHMGHDSLTGTPPQPLRLVASYDDYTLDLQASSEREPLLVGGTGVIPFGGGFTNYYSLTDLVLGGSLQVRGERVEVKGMGWLDHQWGEWSWSGISDWTWMGIQLEDGGRINLGRIQPVDGRAQGQATVRLADGTQHVVTNDFLVDATGHWRSPKTGRTYASGWTVGIPPLGIELTVTPKQKDQELVMPVHILHHGYWEGACSVQGTVQGKNIAGASYTELLDLKDALPHL